MRVASHTAVRAGTLAGAVAAGSLLVAGGSARAAVDGTRTAGDGHALLSTQTVVTDSQATEGGNDGGVLAAAGNTFPLDQLSNAYGAIDATTSTLNLFLGGSIGANNAPGTGSADENYVIALQTKAGGVSNLSGAGLGGSSGDITFKPGFAPTSLIQVFTANGRNPGTGVVTQTNDNVNPFLNVNVVDLTGGGGTSAVTAVLNNALQTTAVGTADAPSFAGVGTGLELSIPLATLGYAPGSDVQAFAFFLIGSGTRSTNQLLSPITSMSGNGFDYTYIDNNRQFSNTTDYPGATSFTVPAASVPEPASAGLIAVAGGALAARRRRR